MLYFIRTDLKTLHTIYDQGGYLLLFSLHGSLTNLISQKFSDSTIILVISVSKHYTLFMSVVKMRGLIA